MDAADDYWMPHDVDETGEAIDYALPVVLSHDPDALGAEGVDQLFARVTSGLSPMEVESLGSALRSVGRWAERAQLGQIAGQVLPLAGTAVGTAVGGPIGTVVGRTIGERAGQAVAGRPAPSPSLTAPAPPAGAVPPLPPGTASPASPALTPPGATTGASGSGHDGSQAAAQLLYLVKNPSFLSSLVALALGSQGQPVIPIGTGDKQATVGAFVNAASQLLGKAAEDADALVGGVESAEDSYLRSETGCLTCDPAVPEQRAAALLNVLQQADAAESADEDPDDEYGEAWDDGEDGEDGEGWDDDLDWTSWPERG